MAKRLITFIPTLKKEIEAQGVVFWTPQEVERVDLPATVHKALFVLRICEAPLPGSVVAAVAGCSADELEKAAATYLANGVLSAADGLWTIGTGVADRLSHPDGQDVLAAAVRHLLAYILEHRASETGRSQIRNLFELAERCRRSHPEVVAGIFGPLDKVLKRIGSKRLVVHRSSSEG